MVAKLLPLSLLFLSLSVGPAVARVGDNWEQCIARYGKPISKRAGPGPSTETGNFLSGGILYTIRFFGGTPVSFESADSTPVETTWWN
jgi:hypothetical protein